MTISPQERTLYSATQASTAEFPTPWFYVHPAATRTVFVVESDEALTVDVDMLIENTDAVEVDAAVAVVANTPTVLVYDFGAPMRLRITAATAPAVIRVTARYNGHGQP